MGRKLQDEAYEDWEAEAQSRVDSPAMLEFERYRQRLMPKPDAWYTQLFRKLRRLCVDRLFRR